MTLDHGSGSGGIDIERKRSAPEAVLQHIHDGADIIMPLANGEPPELMDAVEAGASRLRDVRVHQMHTLYDRPYLHGAFEGQLRHISYFLSPITREAFAKGHVDLVPAHFSEVPLLMEHRARHPIVLAMASPPDRHGYFSLGVSADYVASFIGKLPFFLEVSPEVPRTFGRNQLHISQILGYTRSERSLVELPRPKITPDDERIARYVAEYIEDGATVQAGIGSIPDAVMTQLHDRKDLGVHTELVSDGMVDLFERGIITGTAKDLNPGKIVATFALGSRRVYDFVHENPAVEFWPVSYVNNPRVIGRESHFVSINATLEVDLMGQCASESIGSRFYSGSGGQADFARGCMYSKGGRAFIVLHSTTSDGRMSRIKPRLTPGSAVTTVKNTVDHVVTEYGVAELRGRSIRERARALIDIAHPDFRDELTQEARALRWI